MHKSCVGVIFACIYLAGCAGPPRTASGRTDVVFPTNNRACIANRILDHVLEKGFTPKSQTDGALIVEKPSDNAVVNVMLGNTASPGVDERMSVFFASPDPNSTRMVVTHAFVASPNTAFEHVMPFDALQSEQDFLTQNAQKMAELCPNV
jgi:hypothetical protein